MPVLKDGVWRVADGRRLIFTGASDRGYHRISAASRCLRLAGKERTPPSEAQEIGSAMHIVKAHAYARRGIRARGTVEIDGVAVTDEHEVLAPAEALEAYALKEYGEEKPEWYASVVGMMVAFRGWANANDQRMIPIKIETQYRMKLPPHPIYPAANPLYTQRVDLVYEESHTGKVFLADHKKVSRMTDDTWRQYIMDGQYLSYIVLGQSMYGDRFGGAMLQRFSLDGKIDRREIPRCGAVNSIIPKLSFYNALLSKWEASSTPPDEWPAALDTQTCMGKWKCVHFDSCYNGG